MYRSHYYRVWNRSLERWEDGGMIAPLLFNTITGAQDQKLNLARTAEAKGKYLGLDTTLSNAYDNLETVTVDRDGKRIEQ